MSKIEELVVRLRRRSVKLYDMGFLDEAPLLAEAADALEAAARVMGPFAGACEAPVYDAADDARSVGIRTLTLGHLRAARNWLQKGE